MKASRGEGRREGWATRFRAPSCRGVIYSRGDLPRKLTEGCRLHGQVRASESSDMYAWAVMSVGPDALLFGESIIAMLGLAPINPTRMFVATPRRTRRKLPDNVKAEWVRSIRPTAAYNGPLPKRARCHLRMQRQIPPDRLEAAAQTAHE